MIINQQPPTSGGGGGGTSADKHTVTVFPKDNPPDVFFNDGGQVNATSEEPTLHTAGEVVVFIMSDEHSNPFVIGDDSETEYDEPTNINDVWMFIMPDENVTLHTS